MRNTSRRTSIARSITLAISITSALPVASAKPEDDPPRPSPAQLDEARRHFDQAEAYLRTGAFADAAAAYLAAYGVVPTPVLLFNAGLAWEQHGDLEAAVAHYDRYLAAEPEGVKSVEARARRAALTAKLDARRQTAERAERVVTLRREAAAHSAAGRHPDAIAALHEAQGLAPDDPELDFELGEAYLAAGDRVRAESAYRRYEAGAGTAHRDDVTARLRELAAKPPLPAPSKVPEIVAYSAAGTALVVGILFGLSASSQASDLEAAIDRGSPPIDTGDERFDDGRGSALVANVAFGVTAVAAGVGAYFTIRRLRAGRASATERLTLAPVQAPSGHGAALAYEVRW